MVTEVIVIYNDEEQINKIKGENFKISPFFTFINESDRKSRKQAYSIKNHWAAWKTPFVICMDRDKPVKAFYSESNDVINDLIKYLHDIHS